MVRIYAMIKRLAGLVAPFVLSLAVPAVADDGNELLTIDHYVKIRSAVPAIAGQTTQIYVRERTKAGPVLRGMPMQDRVALFVHGAGLPGAVAFDIPHADFSWMAYLATAGFDTFAMDHTGYGRSTRPAVMEDACNLSDAQRPNYTAGPCTPSYSYVLNNIASDWAEIDAVVDYIRSLRKVDKVALVAWSLGGARVGGYAAQNPAKVSKLVLLAPGYNRTAPSAPPSPLPVAGVAFNVQTRQDLVTLWSRQTVCPDQWDEATLRSVWSAALASDPVGATWGPGGRRAPNYTIWGWNQAAAAKITMPTLLVLGVHDVQANPDRVRELHVDLGTEQKVFVDLGCASHNVIWEKHHLTLFRASLEWLTSGTVNGNKNGVVKLGY